MYTDSRTFSIFVFVSVIEFIYYIERKSVAILLNSILLFHEN